MRIHRLLLYAWWLAMLMGLEVATQGALRDLMQERFFPLLGVLVLIHAVLLFWLLLQKVFAGSLPVSLAIWGMILWALSAMVHQVAPLVDPGLQGWASLLVWGGHGLFAVGMLLHFFGAGLWWWGVLAYGGGWLVSLRFSLPGGAAVLPPMVLGLGAFLFYLGGSYGTSWGIWLAGLAGLFLAMFPDVGIAREFLPFLPILGATLLLAGSIRELAHDSRIL